MRKLTIEEASVLYHLHHTTIRRWIKAGRLTRDEVPGKHGNHLVIDDAQLRGILGRRDVESDDMLASVEHKPNTEAQPVHADPEDLLHVDAPLVEFDRAAAMAKYNEALMAPLVDRLGKLEQTAIDQAEEIGSLRAQLTAARERMLSLERPKPIEEVAPRHWWQVWRRQDTQKDFPLAHGR